MSEEEKEELLERDENEFYRLIEEEEERIARKITLWTWSGIAMYLVWVGALWITH